MSPATPTIGFFGKLPAVGDFVQRRLPPDFVQPWDSHFERAIDTGRRVVGGRWALAYRDSPIWRFVLPPHCCGPQAWAGVIGPGTDRVGRQFPMVLAAPWSGETLEAAKTLQADVWFDALEQALIDAQRDPSIDAEAFDAKVRALPDPWTVATADSMSLFGRIDWDAADHFRLPLPATNAHGRFLIEAWEQLASRSEPFCLWWTVVVARAPSGVMVTRGLPTAYSIFLNVTDIATAGYADVTDQPSPATLLPAQLPDTVSSSSEALGDCAVLTLDGGQRVMVIADNGPVDPRRMAAAAMRETAARAPSGELAALQASLLSLHSRLRHAREDLIDPVQEDGSVVAVQFTRDRAHLWRIGTASAWHWRRGQLKALFVDSAIASDSGELDDLLFANCSPAAAGLGAKELPQIDEAVCVLENGDRLLLLATQALTQLPGELFAHAMALPTCEEASRQLARAAGLSQQTAAWPLIVMEIRQ